MKTPWGLITTPLTRSLSLKVSWLSKRKNFKTCESSIEEQETKVSGGLTIEGSLKTRISSINLLDRLDIHLCRLNHQCPLVITLWLKLTKAQLRSIKNITNSNTKCYLLFKDHLYLATKAVSRVGLIRSSVNSIKTWMSGNFSLSRMKESILLLKSLKKPPLSIKTTIVRI